jgi:hypothetical protein
LHNPGESLSEEISRLVYDDGGAYAAAMALMLGLAASEWARWYWKVAPRPVSLTVLAVLVWVYCIYRLFRLRPKIRNMRLGLEGEKTVGQFLEGFQAKGWRVLHDVPGDGFNIDHVVLSPHGIFAIETKTRSKPIRGPAEVEFDGEHVLVDGLEPDRNPVVQARANRKWLADLLMETTARWYPVRGVVLFPDWYVRLRDGVRRSDVWVLNQKMLSGFIEREPMALKPDEIALAWDRISAHVRSKSSASL